MSMHLKFYDLSLRFYSVSLRKVIILENQTNHNIKNIPFCKNPAELLTYVNTNFATDHFVSKIT